MAEQTDNLGNPPCPARIRGSNCRQSVGERLTFTFVIRAPPAAQFRTSLNILDFSKLQSSGRGYAG
jgi:hypothetical protein